MRRRLLVVAAAAASVGCATFAFAATLGVTAAPLTTWTGGGGVPVSTCALPAAADTYVDAGSGGANFGTQTTMRVESHRAKPMRSLLRVDVASCVPPGARVLTAELRLTLVDAPNQSRTYEAVRATGGWGETTVTWNTQPGYAASPTATAATGTADGVLLTWDVLADVQAFADGTANHGWRLSDAEEGTNPARTGLLATREAAAGDPELAIAFYP